MMQPEGSAAVAAKYKGVRKRKWGRWVSEIRLPNSRDRIWLGSHDSPEKAARAFDAAAFCLRGCRARLNFPESPPRISSPRPQDPQQIQAAAARHANEAPPPPQSPPATAAAPAAADTPESQSCGNQGMDWSFMDLAAAPDGGLEFPAEFEYECFPEASAPPDIEDGGFTYTNSFLWNF